MMGTKKPTQHQNLPSVNNDKFYAAIDYSLNSPAICILPVGVEINIENCCFYFLNEDKRTHLDKGSFIGNPLPVWEVFPERYHKISHWALKILKHHGVKKVFLEDYSFGSKGAVFNIAEHTGTLKQKLWSHGYDLRLMTPPVIKKFATGKGNANKELMRKAWFESNGPDLHKLWKQPEKKENPFSDIVDSYFILGAGLNLEKTT